MTAAGEAWPQGRVGDALKTGLPSGMADDMLIETQLARRAYDPEQLREGPLLTGNGAKYECGDASVKGDLLAR